MGLFKTDAPAAPPPPPPPPTPATFADAAVMQAGLNARRRASQAEGQGMSGTLKNIGAAEKPQVAQPALGGARIPSMM